MTRVWLATALLVASCGPKTLALPDQPVDRAATCGVVAAAQARAGTANIKADLPFDAMGVVFTPSAPSPSFARVPSKLGRMPNTPIDPVIVDGSA